MALLEPKSPLNDDEYALMDSNTCRSGSVLAVGSRTSAVDRILEEALIPGVDGDVALTKREAEILQLIVEGHTNKQMARRLSRSERTVEYHRNRLMQKMAAHNAAQLVKRAVIMGLV